MYKTKDNKSEGYNYADDDHENRTPSPSFTPPSNNTKQKKRGKKVFHNIE
jgi:hypothetical protein